MQLGNPSGATVDPSNHNHYLVQRTVEAFDFSDHYGELLWASWDLTTNDVGGSGRGSTYYIDTNLPSNFTNILSTTDYNGVGNIDFNRGHMCDSDDRTDTTNDNKLVFFMSNIIPQSGPQNQGVWGNLEGDCRTFATNGNELLITCGPSGFGTNTIPSGRAYIASNCWKIAVLVPLGSGTALSRLTTSNRVICVTIPNVTNGLVSTWQTYLTNVAQVEHDTGFTFFSAVPSNIATVYRYRIDGMPATGITNISPAAGAPGSTVVIKGTNFTGAAVVWFNGTNASFTLNSSTQITALVPTNATTGPISVVAYGGLGTSAGNFAISQSLPGVTNVMPNSGLVGASIAIQGTNLSGATAVSFNGTSASSYVVNSANQITATVPANATTGLISVTTPNGTASSATSFTVLPFAPGITNFSPASGLAGASIIIRGTNFSNASVVSFNGANAVFTVNSANQITATVPTAASTGSLAVTTSGGTGTSTTSFTVIQPVAPSFRSITAAGGNINLTITGTTGSSYTVLAKTNFNSTNWITLLTTNPSTLPFTFVDTNQLQQRFYRVKNP